MIWRQPNGQQFYLVASDAYWAARAAMKARENCGVWRVKSPKWRAA